MGTGLLNHLRIMVLPLPKVGWIGGGHPTGMVTVRSPSVSQHDAWHEPKGFQVSAGTGKCFSTPLVVRIWNVLPRAVAEVELLAKSNWMLT